MKPGSFSCPALLVVVLASLQPLSAQMGETWCGDQCKVNSNLAFVVNVPLNPTAQVGTVGWGGVGGVGYNFNKRNAIIAEFMWNRTYPAGDSLQPLRTALQASNLSAYGDWPCPDWKLSLRIAWSVVRGLSHRWRRIVCPLYPSLAVGYNPGRSDALYAVLALVGIQLHCRICDPQPDARQLHLQRTRRECRRRLYISGR